MKKYSENNIVKLIGIIVSDKVFSHESYGENFYLFDLEVPELSGKNDIIPVIVSERLLAGFDLHIGQQIVIDGQYRSYNKYENEKNKLILIVFAKKIKSQTEEDANVNSNEIMLNGFICKKPIYRTTPFGREISDLLLTVKRLCNQVDYIPCIAWGRNARYCQDLTVGENVKIWGRIRSRENEKKFENGTSETRRAYEVSISKVESEENK